MRARAALLVVGLSVSCTVFAADWTPARWAAENTLQLRTVAAQEDEHWFPVWLVVIDDQVYVRLGSRAAGRIERNTTAPYVGVRIAGQEFPRVRAEPAPERVQAVADAMAAKYWTDILVRQVNHPLTMRLVPTP